jgi:hypothetical protein
MLRVLFLASVLLTGTPGLGHNSEKRAEVEMLPGGALGSSTPRNVSTASGESQTTRNLPARSTRPPPRLPGAGGFPRRRTAPPSTAPAPSPPALLAVPGELEIVALPGHADDDATDAQPAAEERAEAGDHRRGAGRGVAPGAGGEHGEEDVAAVTEVVGHHSMISSARSSTDWGIVRPSAFAVFRLITSSNLVGCSTGRSPGLAPFRIRSTYVAARRNKSGMFGP